MRYLAALLLAWATCAGIAQAQQNPTVTIFSPNNDDGVPVFCGIGTDILVSGRITPVNAQTLGGTLSISVVQTVDYQGNQADYDANNPAPTGLLVPQIVSLNSSLGLFTYRVYFANHAEYAIVRYRVIYTLVTGQTIAGEFQTANYDLAFNVPAFASTIPTCADPVVLEGTATALPAGFPLENIVYSGNGVGVVGGEAVFNPAAAGVGTHTVTARVVYRGCTLSKSLSVTVTQTPSPQIVGVPQTTVCKLAENETRVGLRLVPQFIDDSETPFTAEHQTTATTTPLTVEPVQGTDSVYVIIPANANSGTVRLRYRYLAGTCDEQTTAEFTVIEVANLNLGVISPTVANLNEPICYFPGGDNRHRLEGVPSGGTFSLISGPQATLTQAGVGVDFVPSAPGVYDVRYSVVNGNCIFSYDQQLRFVAPQFPANFLNIADKVQFCVGQGQQLLNFGLSNPGSGNQGRVLDEEGNEVVTYSGVQNY
ncbi:MAG: hypothetical protein NZ534_05710, partial [Bacteroidia bacterium]|nr:hypothetical protein [Bacteroidia bacterium]